MWIARDKNGNLHISNVKPIVRDADFFEYPSKNFYKRFDFFIEIDRTLYPEVTFENSPKELIVKPTNV